MKQPSYYLMIAILIATLSAGCATIMTGRGNQEIKQENRIELVKGSETKGVWSGRDLTVSFRYSLTEQTLKINGAITLTKHLNNYSVMDRLHLYLHFVDGEGMAAGQSLVYSAPHRRGISMLDLNFNRLITVPPGVEAIAFTYAGQVSDGMGSDDGAISWTFWNSL
ncbi:MAG: hypothetical protein RBQ72_07015 [Desulfobacterium sp.]|nr:hypothetical protein [Desulfobacterium sp.]